MSLNNDDWDREARERREKKKDEEDILWLVLGFMSVYIVFGWKILMYLIIGNLIYLSPLLLLLFAGLLQETRWRKLRNIGRRISDKIFDCDD